MTISRCHGPGYGHRPHCDGPDHGRGHDKPGHGGKLDHKTTDDLRDMKHALQSKLDHMREGPAKDAVREKLDAVKDELRDRRAGHDKHDHGGKLDRKTTDDLRDMKHALQSKLDHMREGPAKDAVREKLDAVKDELRERDHGGFWHAMRSHRHHHHHD